MQFGLLKGTLGNISGCGWGRRENMRMRRVISRRTDWVGGEHIEEPFYAPQTRPEKGLFQGRTLKQRNFTWKKINKPELNLTISTSSRLEMCSWMCNLQKTIM
jgi:hypothetical protein